MTTPPTNQSPEERVRNPQPRPRVACLGLDQDKVDAIRPLCGTLYDDYVPNLAEVDLLVSARDISEPMRVHVLLYGDDIWHQVREPRAEEWRAAAELVMDPYEARSATNHPHFLRSAMLYAEMVHGFRRKGTDVRDDIRGALDGKAQVIGRGKQFGHEIVTATVEPFTRGIDQLSRTASRNPRAVQGVVSLGVGEAPLVWTSDASLVALYSPLGNESDRASIAEVGTWAKVGLTIPGLADLRIWLWCFLTYLHSIDADAVPKLPPTLASPRDWYTPDQLTLQAQSDGILEQLQALIEERNNLESAIESLGEEADLGVRSVLWADGTDLTNGVGQLLRDLGFFVTDIDVALAPGEPKREDLHVGTDAGEGIPVLVEVKGYSNDAKTGDLRQVREQRELYIEREGSPPRGSWWIINDHRSVADPSNRGTSVPNGDELLATHGVVAIPTRALFLLWRDASTGVITFEAARDLLLTAEAGVFRYPRPSPPSESQESESL